VDHRSLDTTQTNRPFAKGLLNQIAVGVFALLAIATLLLAIFNERGMLQVRDQATRLTALEAEIQKIEAENKSLTEEIHQLRTDRTTIEKLAREELKLVKPGEVVLVTPSDSATSTPPAQTPER
jgi:cell division protein FtsB